MLIRLILLFFAVFTASCDNPGKKISIGDSVFFYKENTYIDLEVYRKTKTFHVKDKRHSKPDHLEGGEIVNTGHINESEFYNNETSFIGICEGFDTLETARYGRQYFIKLQINKKLKIKDSYVKKEHKVAGFESDYYVLSDNVVAFNIDTLYN